MENKYKRGFRINQKHLMFLIFLVASLIGKAQENVTHIGERIQVLSGTDVYIMGSYKDSASSDFIINSGTIHIQGDLINLSSHNLFNIYPLAPTEGTLRFFGATPSTNSQILGNTISLKNLSVDLNNAALSGNVLLRTSELNAYGNISFYRGGLELDTNVFNLIHDPSSISSGIIVESDTGRALLFTNNLIGRISVLNYPWTTGSHPNIKGIGLGFIQQESIGGTPILTRTFYPQLCGDSIGHIGSIERVYRLEYNTYNAQFSNPNINFLSSELAGNPDGDSLLIFTSKDKGQSWRQIQGNTGNANLTTSEGSSEFSIPLNYSVITAATNPCDGLEQIHINQIMTDVVPNDTVFDIASIMVCDTTNVYARIYATGEDAAYFEWRKNSNYYTPQDVGYYELTSLANYWVRMSNIRGCTDSLSITVATAPAVSSTFNNVSNTVCLGNSISFQPDFIDPTATYEWDFGDGTTSNSAVSPHIYSNNGTYTVSLKAISIDNCMSSSTRIVNVYSIPTASFTAGSACPGVAIDFTNNTTVISDPTMITLNWDFGDGTLITSSYFSSIPESANTSHTYMTGTSYTVTLTATANGCVSAPFTQMVTVHPEPVASFSYGPACEGSGISFNNLSSISDLSPLNYLWDLNSGVGPTSTTINPVYTYNFANSYNVSLVATSNNGCTDDTTIIITVYQNPIVNFNLTNACVNTPASFIDLTMSGSAPYSYLWDFGDGNTGTLVDETNAYNAPGTYDVALTVTTANGCVGSTTQSVTIYPNPTVSFVALNDCVDIPINFINTSTNAVSYFWDFPIISTTSIQQNPSQTFGVSGTFPIYLDATSDMGCVASDTGYITIYPLPDVNLGTSVQTCGSTYILDANLGGINNGSSYLWSTGDVTSQYTVTYNGNFEVTVTSSNGCISSDNVVVTLNEQVVPTLGSDGVFCDQTILDAGYPSMSTIYNWSTGVSTQTIDVITTGVYSVTVTDQNGCTGSDTIYVNIVPSSPVYLGADTTVCDSDGLILDAGSASNYLWNDGSTASTLEVGSTGYYWVNVINGAGCNSSDTIYVTVNVSPVFSLGMDEIACDQYIINAFTPNCSYNWSTGENSASVILFNSGTYSVTLTDNSTSCSSSDTVSITINPLPIVDLGNDTILCSYNSVVIDAANSGSSFQWNSGQTTQTIEVSANGLYEVLVTDINGCTNSDNIQVQIQPVFSIDLGPDKQYCPGSTLILDAELTTIGNTFLWEDSESILATTETYTVTDTGMYYLTVHDYYNCVAKDSIMVFPSSTSLYAIFLADSRIVTGDTVKFVNLSYPRPYSSNWYLDNILVSNDSCPAIAFTMPITPPTDTIYATLRVSNEYCVSSLTKPIIIDTTDVSHPIFEEKLVDPSHQEFVSVIKNLTLYPNPNNGIFNLYLEVVEDISSTIYINSIDGLLVYIEKRELMTGVIPYKFHFLKPGMYFLSIIANDQRYTVKFIITSN